MSSMNSRPGGDQPGGDQLEQLVRLLGLHTPTDEQAQVIRHPLWVAAEDRKIPAPLLVVAGAGSGKTETMSLRAVYLAATTEISNDQILGLTFTRKAAAELESRLTDRLAQLKIATEGATRSRGAVEFDSASVVTTYNSFALDVVREFGALIGQGADVTHMDSAASWQLMHALVEGWRDELPGDHSVGSVVDQALSLREAIANQGMTLAEARRKLEQVSAQFSMVNTERAGKGLFAFEKAGQMANQQRIALLPVIEQFELQKRQIGRMDFADQVIVATKIVEQLPMVRSELRQRHQVVFLDEFQDTSVSQLRFLSALFSNHPVTAVGDPNQAIYGWRGASAASLDDFQSMFATDKNISGTTLNLSVAWRNSQSILDVANKVSQQLREKPSWVTQPDTSSVPSPKLQVREGAPQGVVSTAYTQSATEQVVQIVEFVKTVYDNDTASDGTRPSVAVLCRRRNLIPRILEALHQEQIPAETNGTDGLLFHPVIMDLRAALEIANDIGRSSQLMRLLVNLDLGAADLWQLGKLATKLAHENSHEVHPVVLLVDAVDQLASVVDDRSISQAAKTRIGILASRLRKIRLAADRSVTEQVEYARRILALEADSQAAGNLANVSEVLDTFSRTAADYQNATVFPTLSGFLEWLEAAAEKDRGLSLPTVQPNQDAVQIMTIHAAKGLEWDAVAVVDMEMGIFPSYSGNGSSREKDEEGNLVYGPPPLPPRQVGWWRSPKELPYPAREDHRHLPNPPIWQAELKASEVEAIFKEDVGAYLLSEERRLAYVAFTRPRQRLFLVGSWIPGGVTPRYPSVFLTEAEEAVGIPLQWSVCPSSEEIVSINQSDEELSFPKEPGALRKKIALSAAMVKEELDALEANEQTKINIESTLAAVDDQRLVEKIRVLIAENQKQEGQGQEETLSQELIGAQIAGNAQLREFSATRLNKLIESSSLWLNLRRPTPEEPFAEASLGTAFHQWVETELRRVSAVGAEEEGNLYSHVGSPIKGEEPSEDEVIFGAANNPNSSDVSEKNLGALTGKQQKKLANLQNSFQEIDYLTDLEMVAVEVPFSITLENILVRGRIDAIFQDKMSGEYHLIDWKTGRPALAGQENPEIEHDVQRISEYLTQLSLYQEAWKRRVGDHKPIRAQLVFVHQNGSRRVTLEELKELYRHVRQEDWSLEQRVQELARKLAQEIPPGTV